MKYCLEMFEKDLTAVLESWGKKKRLRSYDSRRECLRYQQCKIPESNYTKGGPGGCIITTTTHGDGQETNQGKNDMKRN